MKRKYQLKFAFALSGILLIGCQPNESTAKKNPDSPSEADRNSQIELTTVAISNPSIDPMVLLKPSLSKVRGTQFIARIADDSYYFGIDKDTLASYRRLTSNRTIDQIVAQGMKYAQSSDREGVVASLLEAESRDRRNPAVVFLRARILYQFGFIEEAIEQIDSIETNDINIQMACLGQTGQWCFDRGDLVSSNNRFLEFLKLQPQNKSAVGFLARIEGFSQRFDRRSKRIESLIQAGTLTQQQLVDLFEPCQFVENKKLRALCDDVDSASDHCLAYDIRKLIEEESFLEANDLLDATYSSRPKTVLSEMELSDARGLCMAKMGNNQQLIEFIDKLPNEELRSPRFSRLIATIAIDRLSGNGSNLDCVQLLGIATARQPCSLSLHQMIYDGLVQAGEVERSAKLNHRIERLRLLYESLSGISNTSSISGSSLVEISEHLEKLDETEINRKISRPMNRMPELSLTKPDIALHVASPIALESIFPGASEGAEEIKLLLLKNLSQ